MAASKKSVAATSAESKVKRPISRRRIRANRRNAKKSTGPKSAEGKRIVSRNALVHGLRSEKFPLLPFEDSSEYREFEEAMICDLYPQGVLQRQVVHQITQISWKLRRIPAIEAAMLKRHNLQAYRDAEESREDGSLPENFELIQPTAEELIAMEFIDPNDRPYERLEMYRMRLERGLDSATRMLERLRKQTAGAELSHHQKAKYEIADLKRLTDDYRESVQLRAAAERAAAERAAAEREGSRYLTGLGNVSTTAAENGAEEADANDGKPHPDKQMQTQEASGTIKAIPAPSPRYAGERAGERGQERESKKSADFRTKSLAPLPTPLP